jgi:hypothetical protein
MFLDNHARRLRLEKLLYLELSRSPNGFFNPLPDPGGGFTSVLISTPVLRINMETMCIHARMAGLAMFDQKNVIAVTMPIVTAFKFCIGHRKNGLLNR